MIERVENWQREAYLSVASRWESDDPEERAQVAVHVVRDDEGFPEARYGWHGVPLGDPPGPRCGVIGKRGKYWKDKPCPRFAGQGTVHVGAGRCVAHGGAKRSGRAEGAWAMAHAFAGELDCSPWEALLKAVRIAAKKVAYTEWVLAQASSDLELEGRFGHDEGGVLVHPDTGEPLGGGQLRNLAWWVQKNELWVDRLAKYGKLAIDAGVAERMVQAVEVEGQAVGRVLTSALGELEGEISEELLARVRSAMRRELLALESSESGLRQANDADARVVDSTYVNDSEDRGAR